MIAVGVLFAACASTEAQQLEVGREATVVIGSLSGDAPYLLHDVVDARFASDGRIIVADGGSQSLRVFDSTGRFLHEMGGLGEGPGEFQMLRGMWMVSPDTVGVWDSRALRFTYFTVEGELVRSVQVRPEAGAAPNLDLLAGALSDGSVVLGSLSLGPSTEGGLRQDRVALARFSRDGAYLEPLGEFGGLIRRQTGRMSGPVAFSPFPYAVARGDLVAYTDGSEPLVHVKRLGGGVAQLDVPASASDPGEAWRALAERSDELPAWASEALTYGPSGAGVPYIAGLVLDDLGRVWTKQFDPRTDALWLRGGGEVQGGAWWVVRVDGGAPVRVVMPQSVRPVEVGGSRMLGVAVGELGVERVVVHPIVAAAGGSDG